jgi:PAS domain S-box-containing protein
MKQASSIKSEPQLMENALSALRAGRVADAQRLIQSAAAPERLTLDDLFRLYQTELESQQAQLVDGQRQTERSLQWFSTLFHDLPVPALLLDTDSHVLEANEAACRYLAVPSQSSAAPMRLRRLLAVAEDDLALHELVQCVQREGHAHSPAWPLLTLSGEERWAQLHLSRLPPGEGPLHPTAFVCVLTDLTDRLNAQHAQELRVQSEHLKELAEGASQAKTQLLSRVSHELRTPLNAILGFAQLLKADPGAVRTDRQPYLDHITTAGRDLLSLVEEVLEINRAESGRLAVDMTAVSLVEAARTVLLMLYPSCDTLQVQLHLQEGPLQPPARADARRVREVLSNLVSNAIKYNRFGGSVQIRTGHDDRYSWVEVVDTGLGMDASQLSHLFEPFNRLGADKRHTKGYGLGLSICKAYSAAMGGTLSARSVPGEGSVFRLTLTRWDPLPA